MKLHSTNQKKIRSHGSYYSSTFLAGILGCTALLLVHGMPGQGHSQRNLEAETLTVEAKARNANPWSLVRSHFAGLASEQGLAHWLWQRRDEYPNFPSPRLRRLQQSETALREYLDSSEVRSTLPRLALQVGFNGSPVLTVENGLHQNTTQSLASVTKTFTATAVLMLVAEKRISLEDNIALYFPEIRYFNHPIDGIPIRIRDLLQQSSGISYQPSVVKSLASPYRRHTSYPIARQFMVARTKFHYSNYNYYILAALIERISKQGYDTFLNNRIFRPLHLNHTKLSLAATGAAGLQSSISDLSFFLNSLFLNSISGLSPNAQRLLPESLVREMIRKPDYLPTRPEMLYYGLGIRGQYHKGRLSSVFHTGLWKNTLAEIRYFPKQRVSMVYVSTPAYFRAQGVWNYRFRSVDLTRRYATELHRLFTRPLRKSERLVLKNQ